eukprot:TRINITY_DN5396_c0_g1_i1.p1 TRINITY_DN5396_c0_g1~~TRINITY_DN5396_c0_g1_i1.p1  ORF type:complete len:167 (+),score=34.48 TRINITY_DN5396_c0_g1_i1:83-583(+)
MADAASTTLRAGATAVASASTAAPQVALTTASAAANATAAAATSDAAASAHSWVPLWALFLVAVLVAAMLYFNGKGKQGFSTRKGGYRTVDDGLTGVDSMDDDFGPENGREMNEALGLGSGSGWSSDSKASGARFSSASATSYGSGASHHRLAKMPDNDDIDLDML